MLPTELTNMKKYTISAAEKIERYDHPGRLLISITAQGLDEMIVSDGHHTMDELYDHRITLFVALCMSLAVYKALPDSYSEIDYGVWRSKRHSDGELCFGNENWFVMGIGKEAGKQITYHLPIERWDECSFAEELETAPEFDGHTSEDVLNRLKEI